MKDAPSNKQASPAQPISRPVESLASKALTMLASRHDCEPGNLSERHLAALQRAVCSKDITARDKAVREMMGARISQVEIADLYIPEIARRMGQAWADDGLSFADVTIATARLQGLLRDLTEHWSVEKRMYDHGLNIVVLMLADDFHTLGPTLITSQLRRLGASVRLMLGRPVGEIKQVLRDQNFDAIFISVAHVEKLAATREMVKIIRSNLLKPAPIVVGGPAIDLSKEVKTLTGADYVSNDVRDALSKCGLIDRTTAQCFSMSEV